MLAGSDGPLSRAGREAIYRACAQRQIEDWSDFARALLWDRLCITLDDLARWIMDRGERMPQFLLERGATDHHLLGGVGAENTGASPAQHHPR